MKDDLPFDRAVQCLRLLLEGTSVRSTERLTGVHRDRIISALVTSGEHCQRFLDRELCGVPVADVQADEMWGLIGCKEKVRERNNYAEYFGDGYCFTAIDRETKLLVAWHPGKRLLEHTRKLAGPLRGGYA